ncbi:accessory Sec system translocase SecA2 [Staphylococcus gallinarum]|uniref:accessory Sec system translocase SecA2 n=1 Tax=Staphylococcus gallinarum TaxID=1293 RepID=UPI000D1E20BA|nr:accessory Sec system translocase SecA2 [Staphylococcus gallinarum]MCD8822387.1 accessory Sec system translocase SecA2 [Staphylococcus gallinarum]MCQ9289609.1 accessory Sec system translocase SecA2 [Staphylococcus gallinarum]MEB6243962.1 accessory Sec system translocase SecA2 [Staphylococcus gallinarum]MEB6297131.1 accessory Sec system translocase SecA2 [Staphylococcus gallinarum]PTL07873.1 accessory Sec system translocase SecA2 [Staphylococcus gallinarum]
MKQKINSTINQMRLNRLQKTLRKINNYSEMMKSYSDEQLQDKTKTFQQQLANHQATLDDLLPEAYAVVREASWRVLGMYPKDVQVLGAITLHEGDIAEMQTGEGKTLTATMPLYLNALTKKGAYLITTNDYLAKRDYLEMKPLYEWLGLTASLGFVDIPDYEYQRDEKKQLFQHDIVYTTNGRIGFDYLIDNLADSLGGKFLPEFNYAIIDEVDSIILDAAQTPLVISGAPRVQSNLFHIVKTFVETLEEDEHVEINKSQKEIWLTEQGIQAANHYFDVENIYEEGYFDLVRNINLALRAKFLFDSNLDYFIQNGEIVLIDRITGRMLPGTKLQSGLHQAIEAKEDVEISDDLSVMATITFQNLFKQFERFSGMTATGKLGESEFFDLYSKVVIQIPTDKPIQRKDYGDKVFLNAEEKNRAILEDVVAIHETKRPVLLITRTAEVAEQFSTELFQMNIPNNLLIAQNVAKEAQMIAEAGQLSAVTVATSMAGRGTDIKLANGVHELGGLAVIISEHMENSRVDKQLRGRSGRQGDPGTSQIYISLDDYLVQRWGEDKLSDNKRLQSMDTSRLSDSRVFQHRVQRIVTKAQRVSEEQGMTMREMSNEYEKSISVQRDLIYQERDKVLNMQRVEDFNLEQLAQDVFRHDVSKRQDNLTQEQLAEYIYSNISFKFEGDTSQLNLKQHDNVIDFLLTEFQNQLAENKVQLKNDYFYIRFVQKSILKAIDSAWINQVDNLQQLKASVNNRQNGQRNAIFEYHKVALESFEQMNYKIKGNIIKNLCQSIITYDEDGDLVIHFP